MQAYDLIMMIVLGVTTFFGFRKGLAWQIASVAAIVVSYGVAVQFRDVAARHINAQPPWNTFLAMLILYVGTSFVIWVAFQLVRGFLDTAKLKEFDQQLGAIFGLAKGVLLCVIITLFAVTLLGPDLRQQIINSRSGLYIAKLLDRADAVMPEELHEYLDPYLNRLDQDFEGGETPAELDEFQQLENWLEGGQRTRSEPQSRSSASREEDADSYLGARDEWSVERDRAAPEPDRQRRYPLFERR